MVRRVGSFVAMILVATFVLAACGSPNEEVVPTVTRMAAENAPPPPTPTVEGGAPADATTPDATTAPASGGAAAGPVTIDVELLDIKFGVSAYTVPANTEITANIVNNGASTHNFNIDALKVSSGDIAPGEKKTITFNSGAAGEYEFYCNIPGHKEAGMVGKLTVTEATSAPANTTAPAADAGAPAAQTTFDVELKDIAFSVKEFTVPANTDITINLTNTGAATHNFDIDALKVASGDLAPGEKKTLTFNSGAAGEYEFYCNIPGHKEAGMVGKFIVTDAAPAAPAETTPAPEVTEAPANAAPAAQTSFDVELKDIAFSVKEITVPANTDITINLTNSGAATHNFDIDALSLASGDLAPGEMKTLTFNSGAAGEYEFYCNIPGHKEAGMVGKFIVTDAAPAAPAETTAAADQPAPETASPAASPVAPSTTMDVELLDIKFAVTDYTVPANTEITVNLTNNGAATHNFNIDALKVASGDVPAGTTKTLTFNSGAAGDYQFYCAIPGHKDVGMVGTLHVVDGAAAAPSGRAPTAAAQTSFKIEAKDIAFVEKELTVPANTEITIDVTNTGAATHNFNIDALSASSGDLAPGAVMTVTFNTGAPGEYEYYCNIPGHKEAGMVGKLIVK